MFVLVTDQRPSYLGYSFFNATVASTRKKKQNLKSVGENKHVVGCLRVEHQTHTLSKGNRDL